MAGAPRVFISYSWSSRAHEQWVLNLATRLREDGADVILDKWDLREGHDAVAFMEKMVADATVTKVVIVSDRIYADKADRRRGGVGTETQIISGEVYGKTDQNKFCAVLSELAQDGSPFLPTYYKSRIYIDLSNEEIYGTNYEQLLRWVFDKPAYPKPILGNPPAFITEDASEMLPVSGKFRRVIEALRRNSSDALPLLEDYCEAISSNLESFRIKDTSADKYDDEVMQSIDRFLPYRAEMIQVFSLIGRQGLGEEYVSTIHRLFENLIPYLQRPKSMGHYRTWDFDNFRFIIWELYLYAIAILLRLGRFRAVSALMNTHFYIDDASTYGGTAMQSYRILHESLESFDYRNKRLQLNRLSLRADVIERRSRTSGLDFRYLMQADFVLFFRDAQAGAIASHYQYNWWPDTLVYGSRSRAPFEIFARAESKAYFDKLKIIFQIDKKEELAATLNTFKEQKMLLPRFNYQTVDAEAYMNFAQLASSP